MTPEFPFVSGAFELTGCKVPYFMLTMPAAEAIENLHVARELIFDPAEIVLDELFQRDIDDHRVRSEIAPYLLREGELKFFSALVVVLLPYQKNQLKTEYVKSYDGDSTLPAGFKIKYAMKESRTGKRQLTSFGTMRWDTSGLKAIVVDGQHRYSALKSLSQSAPESLDDIAIPVVLLVLDSSIGFKTENDNLLSSVRKIFIDLNRQAKTVSETRNVLLDDRDPAAVLTRTLMEQRVRPDEHSLKQRLASGKLPLSLVDWYSDSLKFDKGLHITSLLGLYKAIAEFLNIPKLDHFDYDKANDWIEHFKRLDSSLDFTYVLDHAREKSLPVYLGTNELNKLQTWFNGSWGPGLCYVLTQVTPYRSFIEKMQKLRLVDGELECWTAMDRHGKYAFENSYQKTHDFRELERQMGSEKVNDLAFQLIFQKSILTAFVEMCRIQLLDTNSISPREYAVCWSSLFNERVGEMSCNRGFWTGFLIRSDDTLNVTRTAEKSLVSFFVFTLLAPYDEWQERDADRIKEFATKYVHELFEFKSVRGLEGWQKLKYTYSTAWRSLVRKHLQETSGVYGEGESIKCSRFMADKIVESLEQAESDELLLEINDPR